MPLTSTIWAVRDNDATEVPPDGIAEVPPNGIVVDVALGEGVLQATTITKKATAHAHKG